MSSLPLLSMKLQVLKLGMLAGPSRRTPGNDITEEKESDRKEFDRAFKTFSYSPGETPFEKAQQGLKLMDYEGYVYYTTEIREKLAKVIARVLQDITLEGGNFDFKGQFQIPASSLALFEDILSKGIVVPRVTAHPRVDLMVYLFVCVRLVTKYVGGYCSRLVTGYMGLPCETKIKKEIGYEGITAFLPNEVTGADGFNLEQVIQRMKKIELDIVKIPEDRLDGTVDFDEAPETPEGRTLILQPADLKKSGLYLFSKLLNTPMDLLYMLVSNALKIENRELRSRRIWEVTRMEPEERDDFFKVKVSFGEEHPWSWFFRTTEPDDLHVHEVMYCVMSSSVFALEREQGVAALAVFDYFYNEEHPGRTLGPLPPQLEVDPFKQGTLETSQARAYEMFLDYVSNRINEYKVVKQ